MAASSRGDVGAGRRLRFSTPLRVSIVAVVAMAVLAIALIVFSGPGTGPDQSAGSNRRRPHS